ncbi:matrixin family metalloprotease [Nitrosopumilus adriaticus]|uniref:Peptidase metallopeptidase domain-containing protein n=1 Tax=Nitrosopumilus adriaticus TaxID=1580092 RepID=A0A0D5C1L2_9ARCH|nr:matrixin family metalloprotease [Nitrosopumilus adriaticus]AJW70689.1 hypothetical protein NADRNF5_0998 [Nitrosopumilus adriaticus]
MKCHFIKSPDGYYGKEFLEVNENKKKNEIEQLEWPYKYPDGIVTYKIISHSKDIKSKKIQTKAVVVGVRAIGLHIKNIRFKRERDISKNTDIDIYFTQDDPEFIKNPQILAYAHLIPRDLSKKPDHKKIVFNDNHFWTVYGDQIPGKLIDPIHYKKDSKTKVKSESLLHVFMHEFIHKIGLRHDIKSKDAIMWPFSKSLDHPNAFVLHPRDISRLQKKYGKRELSENRITRMRNRRLARHDFKRY